METVDWGTHRADPRDLADWYDREANLLRDHAMDCWTRAARSPDMVTAQTVIADIMLATFLRKDAARARADATRREPTSGQ